MRNLLVLGKENNLTMKPSIRFLSAAFVVVIAVCFANAQPVGPMGGPPKGPKFGGAMNKLFGTHTAFSAKLEMELAQLDEADATTFMVDLGVTELAAGKIIRQSYDLTGLISFLTSGEDEVRAWPISRGDKAPAAAGAIHSDLEKGFIRAEVVAYDDLMAAGSMAEARKRGHLRQEGRNYVVLDGDILNILFSR